MYVAAHADDTLLFQSPALIQDIHSGRCVRTVFLTAGDAGRPQSYWSGREEGAKAAYAQMAGVANHWIGSETTAGGHPIRLEVLAGQPGISIVFLRLPDGGISGKGTERYGFKSLMKLWKSHSPGSSEPADASIVPVDGSTSYGYQSLIETLAELMSSFEPQLVATQNYAGVFIGPDHPDHVGTAYFARAAHQHYQAPHRLVGYEDYEVTKKPENVSGELLGGKSFAFYTYGAHDSDACLDEIDCTGTPYAKWLPRQYVVGSETVGVVANAGYAQTVSPSTAVTLDGSQSSSQSGSTLEYEWSQIGGPRVNLSGDDTVSPTFVTRSHPTLLTFSLTVADGSTVSKPDRVKVRVPAHDPTPMALTGPAQTVASGATVNLDGSASWDPNSLPLEYAWIQTGGPEVELAGSSSSTPSFVAPIGPASLSFSLVVFNGSETSAPSAVTIDVNGLAPAFSSADSTSFTTGTPNSYTVATSGSPTAALTAVGTLPEGVEFTDNGDGTATLSGTPAPDSAPPGESAAYPLALTATNKVGQASQGFALTVVNDEEPREEDPGPEVPVEETPAPKPPEVVGSPQLSPSGSVSSPAFEPSTSIEPRARLSISKVHLPIGRDSRHVVKVLSAPRRSVACTGRLPRGARCRVTVDHHVRVEGSSALRRPGTYPLYVHVAGGAGTTRRTLIVEVWHPARPSVHPGTAR